MIRILHITPHLGGGIGKALSTLVENTRNTEPEIHHTFILLEELEKDFFARKISDAGGKLIFANQEKHIESFINAADIVQLEWWNHPAIFRFLYHLPPVTARFMVWCHQSGLSTPLLPSCLIESANRIILTSECSLSADTIKNSTALKRKKVSIISSGSGCDNLPALKERNSIHTDKGTAITAGYFGSLNFSKLHPDFVSWLGAINIPEFKVRMIGDQINRDVLEYQCQKIERPNLLEFAGYKKDIASELSRLDVLIYLLNPFHYGTAENSLLEAMAMGVIPIVLNNPAEKAIVTHGENGFIISSPEELAQQIYHLQNDLQTRRLIGENAAKFVQKFYTGHRMGQAFKAQYTSLIVENKKAINFKSIFPDDPSELFLVCQRDKKKFTQNQLLSPNINHYKIYQQLEKTKGSAFHFLQYFHENTELKEWCKNLNEYKNQFLFM